jgi:hypothetical protein
MISNLQGYIEVLNNIEFWKYSFNIFYKKYNLKFRNTGNGGSGPATLKIFGVTPEFKQIEISRDDYLEGFNTIDSYGNRYWPDFVIETFLNSTPDATSFKVGFNIPSREYLVYSEIRSSNLENWSIVIPEISKGWGNLLENNNDVTSDTSLYPGFEYDNTYGTKTWNEVQGLPKEISLPKSVLTTDGGAKQNFIFGKASFPSSVDMPYVPAGTIPKLPINLSQRLSSPNGIQRIYNLYGYHPAIRFYADYDDPYRTKFYDWLPLGVEKYKVVLELSTGESVATTFF